MTKKFKELTEKYKEEFNRLAGHPLQSWEWGEFREKTGNKVVRFGLFAGEKLIEGYQLTVHRIPYTLFKLGVFLKGPAPSEQMLSAIRQFAKKENLLFIRLEPNVKLETGNLKLENLLRLFGAKEGRPFFTRTTFIINLTKSEEELLKNMHSKTRYNIRVAQRHGVEVLEDNSQATFEKYLALTAETAKRQGFYAHNRQYHKLMWEILSPKSEVRNPKSDRLTARLLTAKYKGEVLATWVLFIFKDTLYYPYGASSDTHREVMASYLMMWEAIKFGKRLGLKKFDLWGAEEGKGFTKFKGGFAPEVVEFIGTWDLIINPLWYKLYRIAENIRWLVLKFPFLLPKPIFR